MDEPDEATIREENDQGNEDEEDDDDNVGDESPPQPRECSPSVSRRNTDSSLSLTDSVGPPGVATVLGSPTSRQEQRTREALQRTRSRSELRPRLSEFVSNAHSTRPRSKSADGAFARRASAATSFLFPAASAVDANSSLPQLSLSSASTHDGHKPARPRSKSFSLIDTALTAAPTSSNTPMRTRLPQRSLPTSKPSTLHNQTLQEAIKKISSRWRTVPISFAHLKHVASLLAEQGEPNRTHIPLLTPKQLLPASGAAIKSAASAPGASGSSAAASEKVVFTSLFSELGGGDESSADRVVSPPSVVHHESNDAGRPDEGVDALSIGTASAATTNAASKQSQPATTESKLLARFSHLTSATLSERIALGFSQGGDGSEDFYITGPELRASPACIRRMIQLPDASHLRFSFEDPDSATVFNCTVFFPKQFFALRQLELPGGELEFIESLSKTMRFETSGGKSGVDFFKTSDDRFIFKAVQPVEQKHFAETATEYFNYMSGSYFRDHPTSLVKILGMYKIAHSINGQGARPVTFIAMPNLFFRRKLVRTFDLKGSTRNRLIQIARGDTKTVLPDGNFLQYTRNLPITLHESSKELLKVSVHNDTLWLSKHEIVDYSLLCGIEEGTGDLVAGIIDYMRPYSVDKQIESVVKKGLAGGEDPTIIAPNPYKNRFRMALEKYFCVLPDREMQLPVSASKESAVSISMRVGVVESDEKDGGGSGGGNGGNGAAY